MLKKLLTYTLAVTTIVWSVGLLATPLAVGAAVSGDLIKLQCATGASLTDACRAVYYLGADGKRYVFPNEKTYKTWYSDFSGVQIVSSTEMSSYPIGGNVTYRPGVQLVKITTDPKVYAVAGNGMLRWVTTGEIAEALYGANWSTKVHDVPDAFFVNYTIGADINSAGDYDVSGEMDDSASINNDKNLGGDGVSTGTGLTVSLASDTPATGLVLGNSINNKFTKVNLTASADGDIIIDQFVVRRGGTVASDGAFSSVALLDGATEVRIGNTKTINSNHMAIFNQDITVPAGTTKSIYIVGNMASLASKAGEIPTLDLYSLTLTGSAAVVGSLPIVGNYQQLNGTITVGTLSVSNGANNPDASTQKIGTTSYVVSGIKLVADGTEDFHVNHITFDQGETASDEDVMNLELLVDDVPMGGKVSMPSSGKVAFTFANPLLIEKGKTVQVDLRADFVDGSGRDVRFDIEDESDIRAVGQLYGAEVKVADGGAGATSDAEPFWTGPTTRIDQGALRIGPATLSSANIPEDNDGVILGKFEFEATGENAEITSLPIAFTITTSTGNLSTDSTVDLTNVTVYDANGAVVAGPLDPTSKGNTSNSAELLVATSTDTITVPSGIHVYTVKADLDSDFGTNDTIVARINPGQVTAKGETTGLSITPTPASDQSSATMTVRSAALSVSNSSLPTASTVVAGTKQHTFANIVLGANSSGEDIKVTKVKVAVHCDASCKPSETTNWNIFDGATELSVTNTPESDIQTATTDGDDSTATFTFTTPLVITKGSSKTLTVKADINNNATDGTMNVGVSDTTADSTVTARGNDSALTATLTVSASDGPAMTFSNTGSLTVTQHGDTPDAGYIPGNTDGVTLATLLIEAQNEAVNIEEIYFTGTAVNSGGWDQVDAFHVYNGGTLVGSPTVTSTDSTGDTVFLSTVNDPIVVPKDGTITLYLKADTADVDYKNSSKGSSLQGLTVNVAAAGDVTAKGADSGSDITATVTNATGNAQYLVRTMPTIELMETGGTITGGTATKDLAKFTVNANSAGDVGIHSVSYYISTTTASISNVFLYEGGAKVATAAQTVISSGAAGSGHTEISNFVLTTDGAVPDSDGSNVLPAKAIVTAGSSRTYTLRADVECNSVNCNAASNATGGSVVARFLGDGAAVGTSPIAATTNIYENSFLWSDFWRTPTLQRSSTTATATEQWLNGYLVQQTNGNDLEATSSGATWTK